MILNPCVELMEVERDIKTTGETMWLEIYEVPGGDIADVVLVSGYLAMIAASTSDEDLRKVGDRIKSDKELTEDDLAILRRDYQDRCRRLRECAGRHSRTPKKGRFIDALA